ncbi:MAG: hypothetical protein BMS9Abin26_1768 [Gammaproteobacteria bacterium]|nr:MAG: hypothetical protein BMS9Abin26_1768 [Gammaproteobacteria bacterium]
MEISSQAPIIPPGPPNQAGPRQDGRHEGATPAGDPGAIEPANDGTRTGDDGGARESAGDPRGRQAAQQLSIDERRVVAELRARDIEVRAHEAAHLAAAGRYATGGASFSYTRGPDGQTYATGGEVGIDASELPGDPQATLQKANRVRAAALAPANPSQTDLRIASQASVMAVEARVEIRDQVIGEIDAADDTVTNNTDDATSDNSVSNFVNVAGGNGSRAADFSSGPENKGTYLDIFA